MDNIKKNLELVDVIYENNKKKVTLTFLDKKAEEIREVTFNKQSYNNGEFIDDPEKEEKVNQWCQEYFELDFEKLEDAIGRKKDIYAYERFNSLFEVDIIEKFNKDLLGLIFETTIDSIEDTGIGIYINFKYEGKKYRSKMMYSKYFPEDKKWYMNPIQKKRNYLRFEEKFQVPIEEKDSLIGKEIIVEIKRAFGTHIYAEIKPMGRKK